MSTKIENCENNGVSGYKATNSGEEGKCYISSDSRQRAMREYYLNKSKNVN